MVKNFQEGDVIKAIKSLLKNGFQKNNHRYAIWWYGKLLSPSEVISQVYKEKGINFSRKKFNTDQAQEYLLELGFPIVEIAPTNFFNLKELNSFKYLVTNFLYDKSNERDRNIGRFLSEVIWEKSKIWRDKLKSLGWESDKGNKTWQKMHPEKGKQRYNPYTWYRFYVKNQNSPLIFFTIGVETCGHLVYKIDIKRNHKSISKELETKFDKLVKSTNTGFQRIDKTALDEYDWNRLTKEADDFFTNHQNDLRDISNILWPERRLMRILWNNNNWHSPSGSVRNATTEKKSFYRKNGFGGEEWLFNPRFKYNGYQFGFIRGVEKMPEGVLSIEELFLYSKNPINKNFELIGLLKEVELIKDGNELLEQELFIFNSEKEAMISDVERVNGNSTPIKLKELFPNVRFPWDKALIFPDPIPIGDDLIRTNRFSALKISEENLPYIYKYFKLSGNPTMNFKSGNNTGSSSHQRKNKKADVEVNKSHSIITNKLHLYLSQTKAFSDYEISTEMTRIGQKLVDCLCKNGKEYILFEVKTMSNATQNIRQALGQLLEYSLTDPHVIIKKGIIVGPAIPSSEELEYLKRLITNIKIPIEYWSFSFENTNKGSEFQRFPCQS
jgi:hypothetical protein